MKPLKLLLLLTPLCASVASAQTTVAADTFTRITDGALNATSSTTGSLTWTAGNTFDTNGGLLEVSGTRFIRNAFLAFTPVDGFVYELSVDVNIDATTAVAANSTYVGLGFTDAATVSATGIQTFTEAGIKFESDGDLIGISNGPNSTLTTLGFAGQNNSYTLTVILDTTKANWETSFKVDGSIVGSALTLAANDTITHIGIGQGGTAGAGNSIDALSYDNFTLTQVPEPQTASLLMGALSLSLLSLRRKK